jgi:hypothetical protein
MVIPKFTIVTTVGTSNYGAVFYYSNVTTVVWNEAACSLVDRCSHFGRTCFFHHHDRKSITLLFQSKVYIVNFMLSAPYIFVV